MHLASQHDNNPNYVTTTSSLNHLHNLLDHYQSKLNDAVEDAENQEIIEKGNIHNYEFDRKKLKPRTLSFTNGASIQVKQSLGCVDTFSLKNSEVVKSNRQIQFYYSLCLVPC